MKNRLYSRWLKAVAFGLCVLSLSAAVFAVYNAIVDYEGVYQFEEDFSESRYLRSELNTAASSLYNDWLHGTLNLNNYEDYMYIIKDADKKTVIKSGTQPYGGEYEFYRPYSTVTVYLGLKENVLGEIYDKWYSDYRRVKDVGWILAGTLLAVLICVIYLAFVCGRRERDGEIKLLLIDRLPPEITLAMIAAVFWLGIGAAVTLLYLAEDGCLFIPALASLAALCGSAAILALAQSLLRMVKARTLVKQSLIGKALGLIKKALCAAAGLCKRGWSEIASFENTAALWKLYALFVIYSAAIIIAALAESVLIAIIILVAAAVYLKKRAEAFMLIKKGVAEIKNGDLSYRIENIPEGVFYQLAEDINSIGEGMEASLEDKLKAERMKSELITNVSHDLKTPLTSIISYTKILSDMELTPDEANDYVRIIAKKSERLKNLTADLFDYSKVQSGNADIVREKIDFALLVRQSLAEGEEAIKESGLQFVTDMPESAYVEGDGKKLSRVLENLIGNAIKYSMCGTRVYITLRGKELEIKNIANYEMTFDENEITERFVRGDEARTSEGSGLGLAIAKSYVEAMGGKFFVKRDGDLFKAVIRME